MVDLPKDYKKELYSSYEKSLKDGENARLGKIVSRVKRRDIKAREVARGQ